MHRRSLPFRSRKLLLLGGIVFLCFLTALSGSFVYSHPVQAAGPAISKATRTPTGYVIASDHVNIQFEVTAGSSGQVLYTTNNWSSSATVQASKIGTDGGNDVLQATMPTEAANTWIQYAVNATNGGGTTWWTDSDSNDDNNNDMYVVDRQTTHRVYQLFVRTYGATGMGKSDVGTFSAITSTDINNIKGMGFDTIWLTGIMQQETNASFGAKGTAGSPYAITDNWNVSSDLGTMSDFTALVQRIHSAGLKVMMDFVGNHTAREYHSTNAGSNAFSTSNYVWVHSDGNLGNDGSGQMAWGNDSHVFPCGTNDWTDTAMLDYHGNNANPADSTSTYAKENQLVAFWQNQGVDGFRADFAHGIPSDFWSYLIANSRARNSNVYWIAEAYDNDCYVNGGTWRTGSHINALFAAGFDGVYDKGNYDQVRNILTQNWWANGISAHRSSNVNGYGRGAQYLVEFTSNHDEVQPASNEYWGGANNCSNNGTVDCNNMLYAKTPTATALLEGSNILMYNGHEIGEPANGSDDFNGNDGKTSIFDYVNMPQMTAFRNGTLDNRSLALRSYYGRLVNLSAQSAFNSAEDSYEDISSENTSLGNDFNQWLYVFARANGTNHYIVIANYDRNSAKNYTVHLSSSGLQALGVANNGTNYTFTDRLNTQDENGNTVTPYSVTESGTQLWQNGLSFTVPANTTLALQL
jgi:glycosidase